MHKVLDLIPVISACFSIVATLKINVLLGLVFMIFSALSLYLLYKNSGLDGGRRDNDVVLFLNNIISNYHSTASTQALLQLSLSKKFWFYKDIRVAVERYAIGGDAAHSFFKSLNSESSLLCEVMTVLVQKLDNGIDAFELLKEIRRRIGSDIRYRRKAAGGIINIDSISGLGSMLFFPTFAGISLQIVQFATLTSNGSTIKLLQLVPIFAFYIIYTNVTNFRYRLYCSLKTEKAILSSAVGILVFKISSILSLSML